MTTEDSILQPVQVVYCEKCGIPPEYCEYGPDFETQCVPWLRKNCPDLLATILQRKGLDATATTTSNPKEDSSTQPILEPWTMQERLTAFYQEYQPDKVSDVPMLLEKYAGKEDKLFVALVKKYGPEPEDPYYAQDNVSDDDEVETPLETDLEGLDIAGDGSKRRGVKAKKTQTIQTRVVIQTEKRKKRKATTIVHGMDTVPNLKLKDVSKAFSKKFAGSSSVKEDAKGAKQIIIQGDHLEDVAQMVVSKFQVPSNCVFLDFDGDIVPYQ